MIIKDLFHQLQMIFVIEGNIGSGKSTICSQLETKYPDQIKVLYEQVDVWEKNRMDDKSILHYFYSDPSRYSLTFQIYVLLQRVNHLVNMLETYPNCIFICERSHLTDLNIFAKHCKLNGKMNDIEWNTYLEAQKLIEKLCPKIDGIIYNKASVEVCASRIKQRNRDGEALIDTKYLEELDKRHDEWLQSQGPTSLSNEEIPVFTINGDVEQDSVERELQLNIILNWVRETR
jgi:deoxyadenosine/deoxycytidine kinase